MFSYQDLTIISSFSRICQQNRVPRDMEVEVLRYFSGFCSRIENYVVKIMDMSGAWEEEVKCLVFNRLYYEYDDSFYIRVIRNIFNSLINGYRDIIDGDDMWKCLDANDNEILYEFERYGLETIRYRHLVPFFKNITSDGFRHAWSNVSLFRYLCIKITIQKMN